MGEVCNIGWVQRLVRIVDASKVLDRCTSRGGDDSSFKRRGDCRGNEDILHVKRELLSRWRLC